MVTSSTCGSGGPSAVLRGTSARPGTAPRRPYKGRKSKTDFAIESSTVSSTATLCPAMCAYQCYCSEYWMKATLFGLSTTVRTPILPDPTHQSPYPPHCQRIQIRSNPEAKGTDGIRRTKIASVATRGPKVCATPEPCAFGTSDANANHCPRVHSRAD